jgi:mannitol-1-/sugar-/sorbitol-6-phosphatase
MPDIHCQAILFDLDGVLIDAELIYQRHWKAWAERHQVSFEQIVAIHHGKPAVRTMEIVAPHLDAVRESKRFNQRLEEDTDMEGSIAYPGVERLLKKLPPDRWAIATSAPGNTARLRLEHLGLPVPSVLVTPDDVPCGKPAPDPYLAAATGLGFAAADCLVIEDSPTGIESARAAGAKVLALATTHSNGALEKADAICPRFFDLEVAMEDSGLVVSWR